MDVKTGRDVQLYLLVKTERGIEVKTLMDSLSAHAHVEKLFKAGTPDEAARMVRNLDPDTVILDRTVFNHRGIDTLIPIIRDRHLSVMILPPNNGSQYTCLGLDFGIMAMDDKAKDALRWALNELYT